MLSRFLLTKLQHFALPFLVENKQSQKETNHLHISSLAKFQISAQYLAQWHLNDSELFCSCNELTKSPHLQQLLAGSISSHYLFTVYNI